MCVALATDNKTKISLAILRACESANPHGGGVAWREGKRIRWEKGIGAEEIHAIMKREKGPFLVHFRIATVGNAKPELCHPYPVGGNASLALSGKASSVIAHNGTWYSWRSTIDKAARILKATIPSGPWSDSRAMAWLVSHVGNRAFNCDTRSRFARFTRKGIELFGEWHKLKGYHASNLNWRAHLERPMPKRDTSSARGFAYTKAPSLYDQCAFELEGGCE